MDLKAIRANLQKEEKTGFALKRSPRAQSFVSMAQSSQDKLARVNLTVCERNHSVELVTGYRLVEVEKTVGWLESVSNYIRTDTLLNN